LCCLRAWRDNPKSPAVPDAHPAPPPQRETGQGVTWLKEVLAGVADFQKKGANVGTFELRPEYRGKQ
jgi:hypothetical protein